MGKLRTKTAKFNQLPVGWNNAYWHRNNVRILKTETKKWKEDVAWSFKGDWDMDKEYEIKLVLQMGDKRRRDLDGGLKFIMDALTGIVYEDDRQVMRVEIIKSYGATHLTTITVTSYGCIT